MLRRREKDRQERQKYTATQTDRHEEQKEVERPRSKPVGRRLLRFLRRAAKRRHAEAAARVQWTLQPVHDGDAAWS
ncbi:hypothetical protein E2C01_083243 [Portunus trituberculatus]|uniref:Uncharacterized protein n=1 Tax=Portunus trituberculatus TaxID=210409 RepID=A0A5B7IWP9_PORTR|nr:hypothetical protein [Portunus trituberculatus]